jgi:fructose-1-phosphate kinase PfkB-like protein
MLAFSNGGSAALDRLFHGVRAVAGAGGRRALWGPAGSSTGQKTTDLDAARQMIDTLAMIDEKTRGNLTIQERQLIEQLLYELRMKYVEMTQPKTSGE